MAEKNKALLIEVIGQDAVIEGIDFARVDVGGADSV